MAKYACPPQTPTGTGTFADNLVGLQNVQGGGLTFSNFTFTNGIGEKLNKNFDTGSFSSLITLNDLNISDVAQAQQINNTNFKIYPNFDQTNILNFVAYGPLTKRFQSSVVNIINHFPAAIEVNYIKPNSTVGTTATNIVYDSLENLTYFDIDVSTIRNPFGINFTTTATQFLGSLDYEVSKYRNMTENFSDYIVFVKSGGTTSNPGTYNIIDIVPTTSISAGTLSIVAKGNIFGFNISSSDALIIRPNDSIVNQVFNLELDEVDELLLNRFTYPNYTASFKVQIETNDGNQINVNKTLTWPLDGSWNIDIVTNSFTKYIQDLDGIAQNLDEYSTDLISRFYTTDAFKEFDTLDGKVAKTLKIYGRSFDESKKYIDSISHMVSVNYTVKDDVPSVLLTNFAETLGWNTAISPIQSNGFLSTLYQSYDSDFPGLANSPSLDELEFQYYRNLILNSAYLFKSKGTRRAIEFLLNNIGAPEALIEFNENIYLVDNKISITRFDELYFTVTGGTFTPQLPIYDPTNVYRFNGAPYTAFTPSTQTLDVSITLDDYPIDEFGYPQSPEDTGDFYFQKGAGWFESTTQHRSPEIINTSASVFTGNSVNIQTSLEPFTYGEKYLDRFRNFPYLGIGYELLKTVDNKKSWTEDNDGLRKNADGNFDAYYETSDDRLVMNVKNVDLFLNPGQALSYDVWYLSNQFDYPIPLTGLTSPYPITGGTDWTVINPKPQYKDFFEFKSTFWSNMINVRNRQQSTDGKTSGYPTLQSLFWKYLTMYQDTGIENNNFSYSGMTQYINSIGDYWIRLVEQFVPATTIWNTGTRFENSIFHRQKFIYRPQRGCLPVVSEIIGPQAGGGLIPNQCNTTDVSIDAEYSLNLIQIALSDIINSVDCQGAQVFIQSQQYGFNLQVQKGGVTYDYIYENPEVYVYPNNVINSTQWVDFITQGINYLSAEISAIGILISYDSTTGVMLLESQDCEQIDSVQFDLDYINVIPGCL